MHYDRVSSRFAIILCLIGNKIITTPIIIRFIAVYLYTYINIYNNTQISKKKINKYIYTRITHHHRCRRAFLIITAELLTILTCEQERKKITN